MDGLFLLIKRRKPLVTNNTGTLQDWVIKERQKESYVPNITQVQKVVLFVDI